MAPPRAERPIASAAAIPSHLSRSRRAMSAVCAKAGVLASRDTMRIGNFEMRRISVTPDWWCVRMSLRMIFRKSVLFMSDCGADVNGGEQRKDNRLDDGYEHAHHQERNRNQEGDHAEERQHHGVVGADIAEKTHRQGHWPRDVA